MANCNVMEIRKYKNFRNIIFLFVIILFINCSGNKNQQEKSTEIKSFQLEEVDGNYLFDGNTLEGWEITQFGTQGPVSVSKGKIILNYGDGATGLLYRCGHTIRNSQFQGLPA